MRHHRNLYLLTILMSIVIAGAILAVSVTAQEVNHTATITIPVINVDAPVVPVFVRRFADGNMTWDVSGLHMTVGFFEGLPWFGGGSNVVFGGHSEVAQGQADVFYNLDQMGVGDEIMITENGNVRRYTVSEVYRVNQYDTAPIRPTRYERLTLITCDLGSYEASSGGYNDRIVVVALPS